MRYRINHRTEYDYDDVVTNSFGLAYLRPRPLPWQEVRDSTVTIEPVPADSSRDLDYYGNAVTYFQVTEPHDRLAVCGSSEVDVAVPIYDTDRLAVPWEEARPAERPDVVDAWQAQDFQLNSTLVKTSADVFAYAAESLTPRRPIAEAATDLMHRIFRDFTYEQGATTVKTTVAEVLANRAGVCQDFAHLTLACLRSHGLAGRYVSGYLSTSPPPGKERMVGADASHAWAACWIPNGGWLAIDPTNDQWADDRYITVAWGRDYRDVPPVKGVIFSEAKKSTLKVMVDVEPLGLSASP
ncbi:MAG: transglutaminase family protein [Aeromicrobium sp.]